MSINQEIIIVGAGFFGTTIAERLASTGKKVLVLDKRDHIGGNAYSEIDTETGIEIHKYGSHIFHTSNEEVWAYINRFTKFNGYRHTVWSTYKNQAYSMPINLSTINSFYKKNLKPFQVPDFIRSEAENEQIKAPENLEEKAISLIGRPLYEAFIKGYTIKQWEKKPTELSPDIITRIPVRHNYNDRYFSDKYEGIPLDGYARLFERMLDHPNITVQLNTDYFDIQNELIDMPTVYTGPIDRFFGYRHGRLDWRTIDLERSIHEIPDYQGCSVMNYADTAIPYTRIHEFKHYHPERPQTRTTVTFTEYSRMATQNDAPYYPVNTTRNIQLLKYYQEEAQKLEHITFGGRLGNYKYLDMDETIETALKYAKVLLK